MNTRPYRLHNVCGPPPRTKVNWNILPVTGQSKPVDASSAAPSLIPVATKLVCFTLDEQLLQTDVLDDYPRVYRKQKLNRDALLHLLESSEHNGALEQLRQRLDAYWERCNLRGAMLVYPWNEAAQAMFTAAKRESSGFVCPPVAKVKAPYLILNVLGRARAGILLPRFPLCLERGFLERSLFSDDARLVALANQKR